MKTPIFNLLTLVSMAMLPFSSAGQLAISHDLARYSYPIFAVTGDQQHTGTAFLYRAGDTSFLVSNYHAIKGMSPMKKEINFQADTLYLKYTVQGSNETRLLAIDIGENITGATEVFSMVNRIDLLKIPIKEPEDAAFFYINDLIDPDFINEVPEEVVSFGFPTGEGPIPEFYSRQQRLDGIVNADGFNEYDASLKLNFPMTSDSARAVLNATSRYYYFIKPYAAQGYSGAPVFGKFRTANNKFVYRFTGVIFAGQPLTHQTWAIKGAVALDYLERAL